jgi:hypothetical protein
VIQETVQVDFWANATYTSEVNFTSITTLITPYPNGTITNIVTNVYPTNTSFPLPNNFVNPLRNYDNNAFVFPEVSTPLDGSSVVTAGVTV